MGGVRMVRTSTSASSASNPSDVEESRLKVMVLDAELRKHHRRMRVELERIDTDGGKVRTRLGPEVVLFERVNAAVAKCAGVHVEKQLEQQGFLS